MQKNNFDFLRFFFASLVVFSHSYPIGTGTEEFEPLALLTHGQLTLGVLAVDCFFIISGFLIVKSWINDPHPGHFLEKRVRRIYPGFIFIALVDAFVITPLFSGKGFGSIDADFLKRFVFDIFRLYAITPDVAFPSNLATTINGSLWSISYEFWCYILVLALGMLGIALKRRLVFAMLTAFICISFVFTWRHLTPGGGILGQIFGYPPFWARLLPYFIAGMFFFSYRDRIRYNKTGASLSVIALILGSIIPNGMIFALPTAGAYLIFWFAFLPSRTLRAFAKSGDTSYGIYLYSFPILQIVVSLLGRPVNPIFLFSISWPISIVAGWASWHLLEKHFMKRRIRDPALLQTQPAKESR